MKNKTVSKTAAFFSQCVDSSGLTHLEIARGADYDRPNVISMLKYGNMKVPIERIPALAKILRVSPKVFLSVAMNEYYPNLWKALRDVLGEQITLTDDELHVLEVLRSHAGDRGVKIVTQDQRDALQVLASSLAEESHRPN